MAKSWYNFFVVTGEERPAAAPAAPAAPRRAAEVVPELPQETTFEAPVASSGSLADIYSSAQIPVPAHGFTVLKVADMLQSEHIQALPADVKRKSILVALDAAGVPVTEIVEDAVRRDRALDTYERVLQKHPKQMSARQFAPRRRGSGRKSAVFCEGCRVVPTIRSRGTVRRPTGRRGADVAAG